MINAFTITGNGSFHDQTAVPAYQNILLTESGIMIGIECETTQDFRSSATRIFDGVAVATDRKSNAADGRIDKEIWLNIMRSAH